jgi:AAA family ATP:ADP antiporter
MSIFVVATFFEVIETVFDYQLKTLANQTYHSAAAVTEFDAIYGFMVNLLSFVFALVGTSFFIRNFGLRFCLVAFPLTVACSVICMWSFYGLWVLAFGLVAIKGLSYALNNPCKEILYIPTSTDIKFKAKSWIDVFGSRSLKGVGGVINACFPLIADLAVYGTMISLGIIGLWLPVARYVSKRNHVLVQEGKIIE